MTHTQNKVPHISWFRLAFNILVSGVYIVMLLVLVWICGGYLYYKITSYLITLSPVTLVLLCVLCYVYGYLHHKAIVAALQEDT
jgi:hypothetical protein